MKKLSIILAVVLCASVLFCIPVSATGEPQVRFYVLANGTEVTVKVNTDSAVGALQGAVKYDENTLDYDSGEAVAAILGNNATASSFNDVDGATKFALVGNPSSGTSGEWATLTYSVEEGTPTQFTLGGVKAFGATGIKIEAVTKVIMPGDVTEDYVVNVKDYVRYKRIVASSASNPGVIENKDVDMDGSYTIDDDFHKLGNNILGF